MDLVVGSKVLLKKSMMNEKEGSVGYAFSEYDDFDGLGTGVQIIFQNGSLDGFSVKEQNLYLENLGVDQRFSMYDFKNVNQVYSDWRKGYWRFND